MQPRAYLLLWLICPLLAGCASPESARLTRKETQTVVSLARKKLIAAYPGLDAETVAAIAEPPASFSYYCLARNYFQYFITWQIATNRFASVYGQGNLRKLENAKVVLRSLPLDEKDPPPP